MAAASAAETWEDVAAFAGAFITLTARRKTRIERKQKAARDMRVSPLLRARGSPARIVPEGRRSNQGAWRLPPLVLRRRCLVELRARVLDLRVRFQRPFHEAGHRGE